jgi:hypothetical protein
VLRFLLPAVFCPAVLSATPILEAPPPPPAQACWVPATPAHEEPDRLTPPRYGFTVSQAGVIDGLIFRRGGLFNPPPPQARPRKLLGLPEPFAFGLLGFGAVALGFVRRTRAPSSGNR